MENKHDLKLDKGFEVSLGLFLAIYTFIIPGIFILYTANESVPDYVPLNRISGVILMNRLSGLSLIVMGIVMSWQLSLKEFFWGK